MKPYVVNPHLNQFVSEMIILSSISIFTSLLKEKKLLLYNKGPHLKELCPMRSKQAFTLFPFVKLMANTGVGKSIKHSFQKRLGRVATYHPPQNSLTFP